jgi:glycosyltransferase involved in cell wall biosynthesis
VSLVRACAVHAWHHQFTFFVLENDLPAFSFAQNQMHLLPVAEHFRPPVQNLLWHQLVLPRLVHELQLDVLHIPNFRRMLWRRPCPVVSTIHDPGPRGFPLDDGRPVSFFERLMARSLAPRQNEVLVPTECAAEQVAVQYGVPTRRISVVHNGLDHTRFFAAPPYPGKNGASHEYGLVKPFFLYVAPLAHPHRNHLRLIEAFEEFKASFERFKSTILPPWNLVFAGEDSKGAEVIRRAIAESPFAQDIRCIGPVPDFDLPKLYRAASVAIHPALYDGLGTAPLQAMASGCPVISSDRGALKEILGRSAAIVDPECSANMTEHMIRMAGNPELREHWRLAGLSRSKCFDWQKTTAGTLELYAQAVGDSKVARGELAMAH